MSILSEPILCVVTRVLACSLPKNVICVFRGTDSTIRRPLAADHAYAVIHEQEANGLGGIASTTTVFLTASECPIGCAMCDLWQNTLPHPTPMGAIPTQIRRAIDNTQPSQWIKLYNSGNFFDPRSIPPVDYAEIANLCQPYQRVIVENHPRFGRQRLLSFRDSLDAKLEVAVGLETVQPRWLGRLGKQMTRDQFDEYAAWLKENDVDLRVFLIVGMPGTYPSESERWALLSLRHAIAQGARHVSLIPARQRQNWGQEIGQLPTLTPHGLSRLQQSALQIANGDAVVTIDTWDLSRSAVETVSRIEQVNLTQTAKS